MKQITLTFFWAALLFHPVYSQISPQSATLEIHCERIPQGEIYLMKYTDSVEIISDSVGISGNTSFFFHVQADPNGQYRIRIGSRNVTKVICMIGNDSLIFTEDTINNSFLLAYDRIGANRRQAEINLIPFDSIASILFSDTSRTAYINYMAYINEKAKKIQSRVKNFAAEFPKHTWFLRYNDEGMKYFVQYAQAAYIADHEREPKKLKLDSYNSIWGDTVDIQNPANCIYHPNFCSFVNYIIGIRLSNWNQRGIDTTGADPHRLNQKLKIILNSLSGTIREDMLSDISMDADIYYDASFSIPFIQSLLDTLTIQKGNQRTIHEVQSRIEAIKERQQGKIVKDITLPDSSGIMHSLSDFRGKVVFLHFWGTWCGPCREGLPQVLEFEQKHTNDTDIVIVGIAMEYHRFDKWKKFIADKKMFGIQLYAEGQFQSVPARIYALNWVPAYMVLDRKGKFVSSREEAPPNEQLETDLLLAKGKYK